jgi:hypothetical protein
VVKNGGFEAGTSPWTFWVSSSAGGKGGLATSSAAFSGQASGQVTITTLPSDRNVQLYQFGLKLQPNTRYRLRFAASSNTGRDLWIQLIQHGAPYANYGLPKTTIGLTSAWQEFTYDFTTTGFASPVSDARLVFFLGDHAKAGDRYLLDQVSLSVLPAAPTQPPAPTATQPPPTNTAEPSPAAAFSVKINFQDSPATVPDGYLPDKGREYADRGNGYTYGWSAKNATGRDRDAANSPDQRYDTLVMMQKADTCNPCTWEISLPNGAYRVRVVMGDPVYVNSVYRLNVEGVLAVDGTPSEGAHWLEGTVEVTVADGRLTLSNADGAVNNKIAFVEITAP